MIRASLTDHEWIMSVDLKEAYFQLPLHKLLHTFCRFIFESQCYEFQATPFGLASTPLEFSEMQRPLKAYLLWGLHTKPVSR